MRTFMRALLILCAAAIVSAPACLIVGDAADSRDSRDGRLSASALRDGREGERFRGGHRRDGGSAVWLLPVGMLKNLVLVAVVAAVFGASWKMRRPRRAPGATVA